METMEITSNVQMRTVGGGMFDFGHPEVEQISRTGIAWALAMICRFNGHITHHYSVAQHSLNCLEVARQWFPNDTGLHLACLLHDAHEAYLGDITRPVRMYLASVHGVDWKAITERIDDVILRAMALAPDILHRDEVKQIDNLLLLIEDHAFGMKMWGGRKAPPPEREFCSMGERTIRDVQLSFSSALNELLAKYHCGDAE